MYKFNKSNLMKVYCYCTQSKIELVGNFLNTCILSVTNNIVKVQCLLAGINSTVSIEPFLYNFVLKGKKIWRLYWDQSSGAIQKAM